ncbi:thioesterase family protein [Alcanivorax sp. DP30]|uniref:acyl-CoA thioesterase n=1 Tax=Alcanivorax sp. DP30 TaxID=2606217 RepID=UPI001368B3DA|nr:thioesterase family protein [Alcanivorax sp. DP30]MZR63026.1 YbgC/FadM family acyl-CoA thioesterase [Alcanivorax sp. DP30]
MTAAFCFRFRVRYNECDAQQVVFNARYGDYVDIAMTEFFRALGCDYNSILAQGLDNQVVKLTTEWQSSARFDDVLDVFVSAIHIGNTSFTLQADIRHADENRAIAKSEAVYVMMTTEPFAKTPVPDWLRQKLQTGAPAEVIDQSGRR